MPLDQKHVFDDDDELDSYFLHRYDPSKRPEDGGEKFGRELGIIFGGTADAVKTAVRKENVVATIAETGLAIAGGAAIKAAEAKYPGLRPALAIAGSAMTFSFVKDLAFNLKEVGGILADNWNNKDHQEANRKAFAEHGGKFGVDLALTMGGGLLGSAITERTLFTRANGYVRVPFFESSQRNSMFSFPTQKLMRTHEGPAQLFTEAGPASIRFQMVRPENTYYGNGFLISKDGLAITNHHVVDRASSIIAYDTKGNSFKTSVLAVDPKNDLAVVQLHRQNPKTRFEPVSLATHNAVAGDHLTMLSKVSATGTVALSPGEMKGTAALMGEPAAVKGIAAATAPAAPQIINGREYPATMFQSKTGTWGLSDYYSRQGFSGSAVYNADGKVVGVHSGTRKVPEMTDEWTRFAPVSAVRDLLPEARAALQASAEAPKARGT